MKLAHQTEELLVTVRTPPGDLRGQRPHGRGQIWPRQPCHPQKFHKNAWCLVRELAFNFIVLLC